MNYKIPIYLVTAGGVQGMRHALGEVLLNPIISDSFGFSEHDTSWFFAILTLPLFAGTLLL